MAEKRFIDANKANVDDISCYYGSQCYIEDVQAWLDEQPAVDAVEVVHGFNTYDHNSAFECSICGFSDWDTMTSDDGKYNYCPSCGAKMDGERRTDGR